MTNADKYLKDGVENIESLIKDFFHFVGCIEDSNRYNNIYQFFLNEVKPTLTEDEKVILRNIKSHCNQIGRDENSILYLGNCNTVYKDRAISGYFNHLFQFIKPRRRI